MFCTWPVRGAVLLDRRGRRRGAKPVSEATPLAFTMSHVNALAVAPLVQVGRGERHVGGRRAVDLVSGAVGPKVSVPAGSDRRWRAGRAAGHFRARHRQRVVPRAAAGLRVGHRRTCGAPSESNTCTDVVNVSLTAALASRLVGRRKLRRRRRRAQHAGRHDDVGRLAGRRRSSRSPDRWPCSPARTGRRASTSVPLLSNEKSPARVYDAPFEPFRTKKPLP